MSINQKQNIINSRPSFYANITGKLIFNEELHGLLKVMKHLNEIIPLIL